jgi:hypothetical protein
MHISLSVSYWLLFQLQAIQSLGCHLIAYTLIDRQSKYRSSADHPRSASPTRVTKVSTDSSSPEDHPLNDIPRLDYQMLIRVWPISPLF